MQPAQPPCAFGSRRLVAADVLQMKMNSIKQQIVLIIGLLCITTSIGCHATKVKLSCKENPYAKVIMPATEMTNVTFLDAVDRLVVIHKDLYRKHMESHDDHKSCGGFPGLHLIVGPLSKETKGKRMSFLLEDATMAEAFEEIARKFGVRLQHEDGAFADGYVMFKDPTYSPELEPASAFSDDPFAEVKIEPENQSALRTR